MVRIMQGRKKIEMLPKKSSLMLKKIIFDIFMCLYIGKRVEKQLDRNNTVKHEENMLNLILNKLTEVK